MLHLTNGEATASALRLAAIEGDIVSIDDILMEGPLRHGLATPADVLHRAAWLEKRYLIPKADYLSHFGRRDRHARDPGGGKHEEVVLWSEEDLFCQTNLAHFLAKVSDISRLRIAAPPEGPVSRLDAGGLRALLANRRAVRPEVVHAARRFWEALASPHPRALVAFAAERASVWPALSEGARLHLARFPSTRGGLGALERALLATLIEKPRTLRDAFATYARSPPGAYGIGDAQAHAYLRAAATGEAPLCFADDPRALDDAGSDAVWALTPLGLDVLAGRNDAVAARGVDTWLGGVELSGAATPWRWDEPRGALIPT